MSNPAWIATLEAFLNERHAENTKRLERIEGALRRLYEEKATKEDLKRSETSLTLIYDEAKRINGNVRKLDNDVARLEDWRGDLEKRDDREADSNRWRVHMVLLAVTTLGGGAGVAEGLRALLG